MNKRLTFLIALFIFVSQLYAQENAATKMTKFGISLRADFDARFFDDTSKSQYGFVGRSCNLLLGANISEKFEFDYLQRLNLSTPSAAGLFNSICWAYIKWKATSNVAVSAGKEVVAIGGYEYDASPTDVYFFSDFASTVGAYQFATALHISDNTKQNKFTAQISNSTYTTALQQKLMSYNLLWAGKMGFYSTRWSANLSEYEVGKYINFIALGNKISFKKINIFLDYTQLATDKHAFLGKDYSVVGKIEFCGKQHSIFAKATYDENTISSNYFPKALIGKAVLPNTFEAMYGVGVEIFPIKDSKEVRLHAFGAAGKRNKVFYEGNVGITWNPNFLNNIKK